MLEPAEIAAMRVDALSHERRSHPFCPSCVEDIVQLCDVLIEKQADLDCDNFALEVALHRAELAETRIAEVIKSLDNADAWDVEPNKHRIRGLLTGGEPR